MRRESLHDIINLSVNQTLSRTVMASGLTFMTVLALWIFGGQVLNGFAFALVMGIIVGTYSSVFIASPIVIWWHQRASARHRAAAAASTAPRVSSEPREKPEVKQIEKKEKTKTARK